MKRLFVSIASFLIFVFSNFVPGNLMDAESSILGSWPLHEGQGSVSQDISGNMPAHNGTISMGSGYWTTDNNQNYLFFNGADTTGTYVSIANDFNFTDKITVEAYIKLQDKGYSPSEWQKSNHTVVAQTGSFELVVTGGDRLSLNLWTSQGLKSITVWGHSIFGAWHKVAFTYDGANILIYIDDKFSARAEHTGTLVNKATTYIGTSRNAGSMFAKGIISDVKIYNDITLGKKESAFMPVDTFGNPYADKLKSAYAQLSKINSMRTITVSFGTPRLDGELDDECWRKAQIIDNFLIAGSKPPAFAKEKTEAMICYDKDNLYIAMNCKESLITKIKKDIIEHDATIWLDDCIEIFLGKNPLDTYYHFFVNPAGVKADFATIFIDKSDLKGNRYKNDVNWNPKWKAVTNITSESWIAEIAIPWKELPGVEKADGLFVNLCRSEKPHGENSAIGYLGSEAFNDPEGFIKLSTGSKDFSENTFIALLGNIRDLSSKSNDFIRLHSSDKTSYRFPYAYDFGSSSSPVKAGFMQVTERSVYQKQKGYGFKKAEGLSSNIIKQNKWGPDELSCDYIEGKSDNEFIVDLPDGEYQVHVLAGDSDVPPPFSIYVNKEKKIDLTSGPNIYNLRSFPITVHNGSLHIALKGGNGWLLNGLVIYPKEDDFTLTGEMEKLEEDIWLGSNAEYIAGFTRYAYNEEKSLPVIDQEVKNCGFFLFSHSYLDIIYRNSVPSKKLSKDIEISATPGEYEPAAFSVVPVMDLKDFKIVCTDFIGSKGRIKSACIRLDEVKHYYHNYAGFNPVRYMRFPKVLENFSSHNLYRNNTYTFLITVKVPENAEAGEYFSTVTLQAGNGKSKSFKVKLLIYPFILDACDEYTFCMVYHLPGRNLKRGISGWDTLSQELCDMKEHGMNSVNFRPLVQNQWPELGGYRKAINVEGFTRLFEKAKEAGLTHTIPLCLEIYLPYYLEKAKIDFQPEEWTYVKDALLKLQSVCREKGLPDFYFYLDEPWMKERAYNYGKVFSYLKEYGLRNFCTVGKEEVYQALYPLLSVRCYGSRIGKQAEIRAEAAKDNFAFWVYNGPTWSYIPAKSRFTIGYKTWWEGARGHLVWDYAVLRAGMPLNPLSNPNGVFAHEIIPDLAGPVPTTTWEAIREGIDDIKYIRTLEKLIEKKQGAPEAKAAQAYLNSLRTKIEVASQHEVEWNNPSTGEPLEGTPLWPLYQYDEIRREIARHIVKCL
jgi:hypothetical protein